MSTPESTQEAPENVTLPETAPAPNDTAELVLAAHDTVADLVPDAVQPRTADKPYRDVAGAWRVWR